MNTAHGDLDPDVLEVAVRAWTVTDKKPKSSRPRERSISGYSQRSLVIDCETTIDASQRLLFGVYRVYSDRPSQRAGVWCSEEGIFYADDLPETDPDGYATIQSFAERRREDAPPGTNPNFKVMSRHEFVDGPFRQWGYKRKATIVGYNLPFDLARLAVHVGDARGETFRGGVSLQLWDNWNGNENRYRPRIVVKHIDGHRTRIKFTTSKEHADAKTRRIAFDYFEGKFLDLRTLAFAQSDEAHLTLETACQRSGVNYVKRPVTHGIITANNVEYCREDVKATAELMTALVGQHDLHPVNLEPHHTYSAATVGKAYWKALGIETSASRLDGYPDQQHAQAMAAFFGGRAECKIRKTEVPVVVCDFKSMYMTVNALMETWKLITAQHLKTVDVTNSVRELIADPDLAARCFTRELWPQLQTLVEVEPNGATLPVRARYATTSPTWTVGVNPNHSNQPAWYSLADIIAAIILDGPTPTIISAYQLVGEGTMPGLEPLKLRGDVDYDPRIDDLFRVLVEQRHRIRNDKTIPKTQRAVTAQFLKVKANASGYGTLAQFDRQRLTDAIDIVVHTPTESYVNRLDTIETPGEYTFPHLATTITAAARLMLALVEHEIRLRGGQYAFCDTDSMAIVATRHGATIRCPGGDIYDHEQQPAIHAMSFKDVEAIVTRFETLNPYNPTHLPGSILAIENTKRGKIRELWCYAISAKRYRLADRNGNIIDYKQHGLGQLHNPTSDPQREWIAEAWNYLTTGIEPDWLDQPALTKITVSSAEILRWFKTYNRHKPYRDQIKPTNFLLLAYPDRLGPNPTVQPVAAFNTNTRQYQTFDWYDRTTGKPTTITTRKTTEPGVHTPGVTRVHTYRDILTRYHNHPEHKTQPKPGTTPKDAHGLLQRRPITPLPPILYIGKEANDLHQRAHGITTHDQTNTTYQHPQHTTWTQLTRAVLKTIATKTIAEQTRIPLRTIQRAINGHNTPEPKTLRTLTEYAISHARKQCPQMRNQPDNATLHTYLATLNTNQ